MYVPSILRDCSFVSVQVSDPCMRMGIENLLFRIGLPKSFPSSLVLARQYCFLAIFSNLSLCPTLCLPLLHLNPLGILYDNWLVHQLPVSGGMWLTDAQLRVQMFSRMSLTPLLQIVLHNQLIRSNFNIRKQSSSRFPILL